MSLDLLDLLLLSYFGFHANFPWWVWMMGLLGSLTNDFKTYKVKVVESSEVA